MLTARGDGRRPGRCRTCRHGRRAPRPTTCRPAPGALQARDRREPGRATRTPSCRRTGAMVAIRTLNLLSRKATATEFTGCRSELLESCRPGSGHRAARRDPLRGPRRGRQNGTIKRFMEHLNPRARASSRSRSPSEIERAVVLPALRAAPADARRDRALRPQLVQPRRRRARDGLLQRRRVPSSCARRPSSSATSRAAACTCSSSGSRSAARSSGARFKERHQPPAQAVEAGHRSTSPRSTAGTTTRAPGGDVHAHRHRRRAVDGDQIGLQRSARAWNALRYVLHRLPYANKDLAGIGALDALIVGRAALPNDRASTSCRPTAS